jgi:hypothetical protein
MGTDRMIWILCLLFFFVGCEKAEFDASNMNGKIKEIQNGSKETIGKFKYGSNGLPKESWYFDDIYSNKEKEEYTYTYNSTGQLTTKKGHEPGIIFMSSFQGAMGKNVEYTYEYDSVGRISTVRVDYDYDDTYNLDFSKQTTFQYPEDSIVVISTNNIDPAGNSLGGGLEYHFNSQGNIEKTINFYMVSSTEKRIVTETIFTFDSMKSPYEVEPGPVSKNNKLSEKSTTYNYSELGFRSIAYTSVFSYEYTYNSDGYPSSSIETYPNETEITKYFKY